MEVAGGGRSGRVREVSEGAQKGEEEWIRNGRFASVLARVRKDVEECEGCGGCGRCAEVVGRLGCAGGL